MFYKTKIELSSNDISCSFVVSLQYNTKPCIGDLINFNNDSGLTTKILLLCHYFPDLDFIVITDRIVCETYDILLVKLDWFKSQYTIHDIQSNEEPKSYYIFYRLLLQLLDKSKDVDYNIDVNPRSVKIFAEMCRAILAATFDQDPVHFNTAILDLHNLVISMKDNDTNNIRILPIIKIWEQRINPNNSIKWNVPIDRCRSVAKLIFDKLPSIDFKFSI